MSTSIETTAIPAENKPTIALAIGLMVVILIMVLPVPSFVLDLGLTLSFALAVLIFTTTLFIQRPLDFSSFPTVLLGCLILRLSLNISSTKLIIGQGHTGTDAAGSVIQGFSMFVMGGNFFLGLVVFCVLLIVNFLVITKGAGRMAEVGARFALDAMPGKQLAIDSDVASGAITHEEAKERRRVEQEETTFFGSLDGASKFVKGDAIAGLMITLLNLIAGMSLGLGAHNLTVEDALSTYAILTVGDGLVSQIPAVIISIATALLLSKGGVSGSADQAVFKQLGYNSASLATVGGILTAFAFLPGLPFLPFIIGAICFWGAAYFKKVESGKSPLPESVETISPPEENVIGDLLDIDEIHLQFSPNLTPIVMDQMLGLDTRIVKIRRFVAEEYGFVLPPVRLTDDLTENGEYAINIQGNREASGNLEPDHILVILDEDNAFSVPGVDVTEPVYGAPSRWISPKAREEAESFGLTVVEPAEIIVTHLLETLTRNFSQLMTRRALRRMLDEFKSVSDPSKAKANARIIDEFIPEKAPIEYVQGIFKQLLEDGVPLRNIPMLLEAVAEAHALGAELDNAVELVRRKMAASFISRYLNADGVLPLIQISLEWEDIFSEHETTNLNGKTDVALTPELFNKLTSAIQHQVSETLTRSSNPVIVTFSNRRRFIQTLVRAKSISCPVLSYEEIDPRLKMSIIGKV